MDLDELASGLRDILPDSRLLATSLNLCPELSLYLLDDSYPQHLLSPEQTAQLMHKPPYWCFCWASGDVLARYLLDNPAMVSGKKVLDFGAGSGVAGIAAALAGASEVYLCDSDRQARMASLLNAKLNGVKAEVLASIPEGVEFDLLLVSDVLYDRDNLSLLPLLEAFDCTLLLADSRVPGFSRPGYQLLGSFESSTWPDLDESASFRHVRLFQFDPGIR